MSDFPTFAWLVVFVTVLAITCMYEIRLWAQQRQAGHHGRPAAGAKPTR
jgi:hypothetical protein